MCCQDDAGDEIIVRGRGGIVARTVTETHTSLVNGERKTVVTIKKYDKDGNMVEKVVKDGEADDESDDEVMTPRVCTLRRVTCVGRSCVAHDQLLCYRGHFNVPRRVTGNTELRRPGGVGMKMWMTLKEKSWQLTTTTAQSMVYRLSNGAT